MNLWQLVQQLEWKIRRCTWEDGASVVFASDSVIISEAVPEQWLAEAILPIAQIGCGGAGLDPEHSENPAVRREEVKVTIGHMNENDRLGRAVLIGARSNGANDSAGRGLLEIQEVVDAMIDSMNGEKGVQIGFVGASAAEPARHPTKGLMVMRTLVFGAWVGSQRHYPPATSLRAIGGAGSAALTWKMQTRFDSRRAILRRAVGAVAPAGPALGTGVVLGGAPDGAGVVAVTQLGVAAATYSYALFLAYDETGSGADERFSVAATCTVVVT